MTNKNFVVISNQRCGSTWFITSVGNCNGVETDYEIKWSKQLLLGKPSPYHLFLSENKIKNIFKSFSNINNKNIYGTKFVFDFYKPLPFHQYKNFLTSFDDYKIIHIVRDYVDILKSKLIGKVTHLLDTRNIEKKRLIDNTILDKQEEYINTLKLSNKNNQIISFKAANSYLVNLFINDVLALSVNNKKNFISIKYEDIQSNMGLISSFLNISVNELKHNFFDKPTIKKNDISYANNFENYKELQKINFKLKNKINELRVSNFEFDKIIQYDEFSKKLNINI